MPTENRSSNTDMISVPRDLAEEICNGLRITQERGVKELRAILAQPAEQHHGEPVAYAVFADNGNIRIWSTNCEAVGIKVMQEEGKHAVPLFTHATPGEVERLRAMVELAESEALSATVKRDELLESAAEGASILRSLIENIEAKGNYSPESTVSFLQQALHCVSPALSPSASAEPTQGGAQ